MKKALQCTIASILVVLVFPDAGWAQQPATCYTKAVKVTGGLSLLEGGARSKARGTWIKKVRDSKKLGPAYAGWLRAKDQKYNCRRVNKRHQCEASAVPCKI